MPVHQSVTCTCTNLKLSHDKRSTGALFPVFMFDLQDNRVSLQKPCRVAKPYVLLILSYRVVSLLLISINDLNLQDTLYVLHKMSGQLNVDIPLETCHEQQNFRLLEIPPDLLRLITAKSPPRYPPFPLEYLSHSYWPSTDW